MHMTSSPRPPAADAEGFYPTSDGRPVGETPAHFRNSLLLTDVLDAYFVGDPRVYIAGNLFLYYVQGDRWKHVSPDVMVVRGVPKDKPRKAYFLWEEGKAPDLVVEVTSASTKEEDLDDKKWIYQHLLGVQEYVLFDPYAEYLNPALQGFELDEGEYVPMPTVAGRLPSEVLGLHFEADGKDLRLYDPAVGRWLLTPQEVRQLAAETAAERDQTAAKLESALHDKQRLEQELDELRRRLAQGGAS